LILGLLLIAAPLKAAAADELLHLSADHIQFYYDRFVVEADGNVRVEMNNGVIVRGDSFSMDLKLNRFLLAGNVDLSSSQGTIHGAALSDFLSLRRIYFVPVTSEPDRWTYLDEDFSHPQKGREMPGDAFFFPDLGRTPVYIYAKRAVISPNNYVSFRPARVDLTFGALPTYLPMPNYVINFSSNPNVAQNSLSGANADATYPFAGSSNAISAVHLRYDTYNKTYLAFEQHLATQKQYAVFSVNPVNRPSKFWNLLLMDHYSTRAQIQSFTQLHTFQSGLSLPVESSQYTDVTLTQAFRQSYLQISGNFYNQSLLAEPALLYFNDPSHIFNAAHPLNFQATWTSFDHRIGKLPLFERVHYGLLYARDQYGIQGYATPANGACSQNQSNPNYCANSTQQPYGVGTILWENNAGLTLYTPSFKLGKNVYLNAVFDKQRRWGPPHYVDTESTTVSASRVFGRKAATYLAYYINNVSDIYGSGSQSLAYPPYVPIVGGVPYPGFAAFQGKATYRTLTGSFSLTPSPNLAFTFFAQSHRDFPAPIPFFYGSPPYNATADLRVRINAHTTLDIQRSYYFNFANQTLSPQWTFQVLP